MVIYKQLRLSSHCYSRKILLLCVESGIKHNKSNQTKPSYLVSGSVAQEMDLIDGNQ
jgi:hypothetical protein